MRSISTESGHSAAPDHSVLQFTGGQKHAERTSEGENYRLKMAAALPLTALRCSLEVKNTTLNEHLKGRMCQSKMVTMLCKACINIHR